MRSMHRAFRSQCHSCSCPSGPIRADRTATQLFLRSPAVKIGTKGVLARMGAAYLSCPDNALVMSLCSVRGGTNGR